MCVSVWKVGHFCYLWQYHSLCKMDFKSWVGVAFSFRVNPYLLCVHLSTTTMSIHYRCQHVGDITYSKYLLSHSLHLWHSGCSLVANTRRDWFAYDQLFRQQWAAGIDLPWNELASSIMAATVLQSGDWCSLCHAPDHTTEQCYSLTELNNYQVLLPPRWSHHSNNAYRYTEELFALEAQSPSTSSWLPPCSKLGPGIISTIPNSIISKPHDSGYWDYDTIPVPGCHFSA